MGTGSISNKTKSAGGGFLDALMGGGARNVFTQENAKITRHNPVTGGVEKQLFSSGAKEDLPVLPGERLMPTKRPVYRTLPVRRSRK